MEVNMKFRKNKKGFTLVELVVVIAILAILASVATVATVTILNNARKSPVVDTASSVKSQIQYWYATGTRKDNAAKWSSTDTKIAPETLSGFISEAIQDFKGNIQTTAVAQAKNISTTDDNIHLACSNTTGSLYADATYHVYVFTKYYYCDISVTVKDNAVTNVSVGDAIKLGN